MIDDRTLLEVSLNISDLYIYLFVRILMVSEVCPELAAQGWINPRVFLDDRAVFPTHGSPEFTLAVMYMRLFRTSDVASGEPQPLPLSPCEVVTSPSRSLTSSSGLLGLDPGRRSLLSTSSMLCSQGSR